MATFLLLHGGAGSASVTGFAERLTAGHRVLTPTHPGFDGTPRLTGVSTIRHLAAHYAEMIRDEAGVTVVGNSIGGWIAAEIGLLHPPQVSRVVIVDGVGIEVPGHPLADFFSLTPPEIARLSYADPARFPLRAPHPGNREALQAYGGTMTDPTLRDRLAAMRLPTTVIWGEADGIAPLAYGRAYAAAVPGAEFVVLPGTGHLPQIESPDLLLKAIG